MQLYQGDYIWVITTGEKEECMGGRGKRVEQKLPPLTCTSDSASAVASGNQCSFWWYLYSSSFLSDTLPKTCNVDKRNCRQEANNVSKVFFCEQLQLLQSFNQSGRHTETSFTRQKSPVTTATKNGCFFPSPFFRRSSDLFLNLKTLFYKDCSLGLV